CYNNNCLTHLSSKKGSGWFPQKPRRCRQIAIAGRGYTLSITSSDSDCSSITEQSIQVLEEGLSNNTFRHSSSLMPSTTTRDVNKG
ncbi:hypothetical protein M406DRAFT_249977, partial [Cryphonectria parasitica EP155]